jgi:hypothetical protein
MLWYEYETWVRKSRLGRYFYCFVFWRSRVPVMSRERRFDWGFRAFISSSREVLGEFLKGVHNIEIIPMNTLFICAVVADEFRLYASIFSAFYPTVYTPRRLQPLSNASHTRTNYTMMFKHMISEPVFCEFCHFKITFKLCVKRVSCWFQTHLLLSCV